MFSPSQSPFELRPCLVTQKSAKLSIGGNDPVISKLPNLYLHNILKLYWQRLQGKGRTRYKLYLKLIKDVRKQNCKDMLRSCNIEQRKSYKVKNESWKSTVLCYLCSIHTTNARLLITYLKIIKLNTYYYLMVCVTKMEIFGKQTYHRKEMVKKEGKVYLLGFFSFFFFTVFFPLKLLVLSYVSGPSCLCIKIKFFSPLAS